MIKIIRGLLIFFIAAFIFLSMGIYLVLNESFVQNRIISYINTHYLEKSGFELGIKDISYNLMLSTLQLSELQIKDISTKSDEPFKVSAESVSIKFNFLSSYAKNTLVIDKLRLKKLNLHLDYDENGKLILPSQFISKNPIIAQKPKPLTLIQDYFSYIPENISIIDSSLHLGQETSSNFQFINLHTLNISKKNKFLSDIRWLDISVKLNPSELRFNSLNETIKIEELNLSGQLNKQGVFDDSKLHIKSNIANIDSQLSLKLYDPFLYSSYDLQIQKGKIFNTNFFNLMGLDGSGILDISGQLHAEQIQKAPLLSAHVNWNAFYLYGFNLQKGHTDISFSDKVLSYNNAILKSGRNGQITASGKYQFFDEFYFENIGKIKHVYLDEVLEGVRAKQETVDALISTDKFVASGFLQKTLTNKNHSKTDVLIQSDIQVNELSLVNLEKDERKPLPPIYLDLSVQINDGTISFNNSLAHINTYDSKEIIQVTNSKLVVTPSVDFMMSLVGKNLDLGFVEYFIKSPAKGLLDFDGNLTYDSSGAGLKFISKITAVQGSVNNIPFAKATGIFSLFDTYLTFSNVYINTIDPVTEKNKTSTSSRIDEKSFINVNSFSFRYKDQFTKLVVSAQGKLATLLKGVDDLIPNYFREIDGDITSANMTMSGYLLNFETWKLTFNGNIHPFITPGGKVNNASFNLKCAAQTCRQSKILLSEFYSNEDPSSLTESSALIVLYNISQTKSNFAFQFENVPLGFFNTPQSDLSGKIYGLGEIHGTWTAPHGRADLTIDHLLVEQRDLGQFKAVYSSNVKSNSNLYINAFNNQIDLNLNIPLHSQNSQSILKAYLKGFNLNNLIEKKKQNSKIYSKINATISARGPWITNFKNGFSFLKEWTGNIILIKSNLQYYGANIDITSQETILYQDNTLLFNNLMLNSKFGEASIDGQFNLENSNIVINSNIDMDLDPLSKEFHLISDSEGKINGKVTINGSLKHPIFAGNLSIKSSHLSLVGDEPEFSNIEGIISLHDSLIEIQKLSAIKGKGNINLTGNFDFKNLAESNFSYPIVNLHLVTQRAEFEFPVPIFRTADLIVTSNLHLSGQSPPFLIQGRADIQNLTLLRDLTCSEIFAEYKSLPIIPKDISVTPFAKLKVNVQAINSLSIQSNCLRGKFSASDNLNIVGTTSSPLLDGGIVTDSALFNIIKARFDVKKGEFLFSENHKFDPYVDIQMDTRIASYNIFWDVSGRLSTANLNLTALPATLPSGNAVDNSAILYMITTGQVPTEDSLNTLLATSRGVYSYFGANNSFYNVVNQTFSTVTGGLFDTLGVAPNTQGGSVTIKVTASKHYSQRLSFGVEYEGGSSGGANSEATGTTNTSSAFINYLLNQHIGFTASYATNLGSTSPTSANTNEFAGGLKFNFGSY